LTFAGSRSALHAVAEHVLGAGRYQADGHIGLEACPGGFTTPVVEAPSGWRRLAVIGTSLHVLTAHGDRAMPLTTIGELAAFAGVAPGMPASVYTPTTPLDLEAPLAVDPDDAVVIARWFSLTSNALASLGWAGEATLWPEHFDLGCSVDEVNYGGSPGDDGHPEPYLYVGPWTPRSGDFWNESFGASLGHEVVHTVDDAVVFFTEGRAMSRENPPS